MDQVIVFGSVAPMSFKSSKYSQKHALKQQNFETEMQFKNNNNDGCILDIIFCNSVLWLKRDYLFCFVFA